MNTNTAPFAVLTTIAASLLAFARVARAASAKNRCKARR